MREQGTIDGPDRHDLSTHLPFSLSLVSLLLPLLYFAHARAFAAVLPGAHHWTCSSSSIGVSATRAARRCGGGERARSTL